MLLHAVGGLGIRRLIVYTTDQSLGINTRDELAWFHKLIGHDCCDVFFKQLLVLNYKNGYLFIIIQFINSI